MKEPHKDPLAIAMFAIGVIPLIKELATISLSSNKSGMLMMPQLALLLLVYMTGGVFMNMNMVLLSATILTFIRLGYLYGALNHIKRDLLFLPSCLRGVLLTLVVHLFFNTERLLR